MAWRVTEEDVRDVIESDDDLRVQSFIETAGALTDYVSSQDSAGSLTVALLKQIELYLAAHFYAHRDQPFQENETADASATFQGQFGMRLDSTRWGQTAITLDISGTLTKLNAGVKKISISWLGLPPSEQTAYIDRR